MVNYMKLKGFFLMVMAVMISISGMSTSIAMEGWGLSSLLWGVKVVGGTLTEIKPETPENEFNAAVVTRDVPKINDLVDIQEKILNFRKRTPESDPYNEEINSEIVDLFNGRDLALICIYWWNQFDLEKDRATTLISDLKEVKKSDKSSVVFYEELQEEIYKLATNLQHLIYYTYNVEGTGLALGRAIKSLAHKFGRYAEGSAVIVPSPKSRLSRPAIKKGIRNPNFGVQKVCENIKTAYREAYNYTAKDIDSYVQDQLKTELLNLTKRSSVSIDLENKDGQSGQAGQSTSQPTGQTQGVIVTTLPVKTGELGVVSTSPPITPMNPFLVHANIPSTQQMGIPSVNNPRTPFGTPQSTGSFPQVNTTVLGFVSTSPSNHQANPFLTNPFSTNPPNLNPFVGNPIPVSDFHKYQGQSTSQEIKIYSKQRESLNRNVQATDNKREFPRTNPIDIPQRPTFQIDGFTPNSLSNKPTLGEHSPEFSPKSGDNTHNGQLDNTPTDFTDNPINDPTKIDNGENENL